MNSNGLKTKKNMKS